MCQIFTVSLFYFIDVSRYYPATIEKILEDGMCTVIFDGYTTAEMAQVRAKELFLPQPLTLLCLMSISNISSFR